MNIEKALTETVKRINAEFTGGAWAAGNWGARVIKVDGKRVIYVEETGFDAMEIAGEVEAPKGYFLEPINMVLIGVYPV